MMKPAIAALAALTACAGVVVPQAQAREKQTTVIQYNDLDLNRPSQVAELDRRLDEAVTTLCSRAENPTMDAFHARQRCLNQARTSAEEGRALALADTSQRQGSVNFEDTSS
ncbi:UrcA family protein [Novosphingobium malaysiense]|uniref:UrcA family protein n=1 Tax=Novosphingobium malaysiense TaxID=1348853 RepID=A0A0B1ZNB2_9SPHN|nr:UrcA family protein [Novosphingobium malaysiense]KHK92605.1 hypothetical protein LK12_07500 [Novosphingobium malaysiense]